jgi:hypothetical protein
VAAGQSGELVARSAPGLRDYRRRLRALHAKNPFKQQYTEPPVSESSEFGASSGGATSASAASPAPAEPITAPSAGGEGSTTTTETTTQGKLAYYSYAIDVRVVPTGQQSGSGDAGKSSGNPTIRRNLPELTMLPSRSTPAATYMGASKDGKKALFLISSDVQAVFGDGRCVVGTQTCQLLAVEPGLPQTFVYGPANRTFKIELLKVHLVRTENLNRAPLGKSKPKPAPRHSNGD